MSKFAVVVMVGVSFMSMYAALGLTDEARYAEAAIGGVISFLAFRTAGWIHHHYGKK